VTRLAIIERHSLIGEAIRDALGTTPGAWDQIDLLTADPEGVGGVTEVAGEAALVQALDPEDLANTDVALFCGSELDDATLELLAPTTRAIFVTSPEPIAGAIPVVAGINLEEIAGTNRILSPDPAVIMLSHLLAPLGICGKITVVAHVLAPASTHDQAGIDELFDQTRAILSLSEERPEAVFGTQLAFNLIPWQGTRNDLAGELSTVLQSELRAQIHTSQAGVFHCCSVGFYLDLEKDPGLDEVQALLNDDPLVETHPQPDYLGPVAAAASDKILLGQIVSSPTHGYWVWAVMDNLTGAANNALAIARY
jgi:aspartate-semialdehyde dehydrogenase